MLHKNIENENFQILATPTSYDNFNIYIHFEGVLKVSIILEQD